MKTESTTKVPRRHLSQSRAVGETQSANSIAVLPRFVSQHTASAILGFKTARAYLEWLAKSGCRIVERGKDRLVLLDEAEQALLRLSGGAASVDETDHEAPVTAADVLARIGRHAGGVR